MHPILFELPTWAVLILAGGVAGAWLVEAKAKQPWVLWLGAAAGAGVALLVGRSQDWLAKWVPVQGYGTLILTGFLVGVWLARRRAPRIGVAPHHCLDLGLWGVLGGLAGARLFYVLTDLPHFSPFGPAGPAALLKVLAFWEGGLVFFGAFVAAILVAFWYSRHYRLPVVPMLDLAAPGLIAGQAFGRLGCFLRGCCFGKTCDLPWAVRFPQAGEAYQEQLHAHQLPPDAAWSLPVHPTQLYAFLGAALTVAFLYALWPRRRYDGQVFGLMLVLAGVTRFFEEFLRADVGAGIPSLSPSLTIAQWFALVLVPVGFAWLMYARRRNTRYSPLDGETG